ncbi:MAG: VanW family protein [Lachnospiraceae bacterium]|nr:VanW family protein [Lachnospiraceae bacterium]
MLREALYHKSFGAARAGMLLSFAAFLSLFLLSGQDAQAGKRARAGDTQTIPKGIYIGPVDVGGLTADGARAKVDAFLEEAGGVRLTLKGADEDDVQGVTPQALGLKWNNPDITGEAFDYGRKGNAVKRYKELKDLEHQTRKLPLDVSLDEAAVRALLDENAKRYEQKAVNYELHRVNGQFEITSGQTGMELDVNTSLDRIMKTVSDGWDFKPAEIELAVAVQEPKGGKAELESVRDVLGTYTTSYKTSSAARRANVENGCRLASDATVYPGEEYSVLEHITPFTEANGYKLAGSYLNGQVVDSLGGGICQVSTTLYNAVLRAELNVTERHNHSMIVGYVSPSADAAIAESSGKDFKFVNNMDTPVYIEGYTTEDKKITFVIYGKEVRDPDHKVSFESETLEKTEPDSEVINANASLPAGEIHVQSAHIGYKAQLWKVVTEKDVQVSREVINKSYYQMVPRTATVGTATADPSAAERISQAIATGSIDQVRAVADAIRAGAALPQVAPPPEAPAPAPAEAVPAPQPEAPQPAQEPQPEPPAEEPVAVDPLESTEE